MVSVPLGVILKTEPALLAPPEQLSRRSPIGGLDQPGGAAAAELSKLCSVVSVPLGVILKTVPS